MPELVSPLDGRAAQGHGREQIGRIYIYAYIYMYI